MTPTNQVDGGGAVSSEASQSNKELEEEERILYSFDINFSLGGFLKINK